MYVFNSSSSIMSSKLNPAIIFFLLFIESPVFMSSETESTTSTSTSTSDSTANSCKSDSDCLQPIGSYCHKRQCQCKIFHTDQPLETNNSMTTTSSTSTTIISTTLNQSLRICLPITCSKTKDCGVGEGAEDLKNDLLTCVSSFCHCKSPLVLVDENTHCGSPIWLLVFKWGGYISIGACLFGTLACCCNWCGVINLCTGRADAGEGNQLVRGSVASSSMITIKSAAIIGRKPAPPPSLKGSPLSPLPDGFLKQQMKIKIEKEVDGDLKKNKSDSKKVAML